MLSLRDVNVSLIDCDHRTPLPAEEGYPYVAIPQIKEGRLDLANARKISRENFVEWTRKAKPIANDVVLSRRCNPGETAFVAVGMEFALGQNLVLLRADGKKIFPPFLRWLVQGPQWWGQVGEFINVGAIFDSLKCADIPKFQLQIPPLPIQHAIAHILGSLDDKIELNRRMNETLEAMARALFKDWFVEFGPVRAKMEGRQPPGLSAEVAALFPDALDAEGKPVGWEILPLDEVADFLNGLALQKFPGDAVDDLPIIKIAELRAGLVDNGIRASKTIPSQYVIENGDVIFSWSGSLIQRIWTSGKGALNQHLFKVTSTRFPKWFHYYWVEHHLPNFQAIAASKATTMGHIQRHHLSEAETIVGDDALMKAADDMFAPFFNQIVANSLESHTLAALRDLLLPKLLSGELRVRPPCDSRTTPDENSR